jgi:hypothetical protein
MRIFRNAISPMFACSPMNPDAGSTAFDRPRNASVFVYVVVTWPLTLTV